MVDIVPSGGLALGGRAPVRFRPGGGLVESRIVVEWDLDGDGDFDQPEENVTRWMQRVETVAGRDAPSDALGQTSPGECRLTLTDHEGLFSNWRGPLNTPPFSLDPGRTLRVRVAEAEPDDPRLLVRDRFRRQDGQLGTTETGQEWRPGPDGGWAIKGRRAVAEWVNEVWLSSIVDTGRPDYYVQAAFHNVAPGVGGRRWGLTLREQPDGSCLAVVARSSDGRVEIIEMNGAGVIAVTTLGALWDGITMGAAVEGNRVTVYIAGVEVLSAESGWLAGGTYVGLLTWINNFSGPPVEVTEFHVWDHLPRSTPGVLWTGDVRDVSPTIGLDERHVTVTADGVLARAARAKIDSPRLARVGHPVGMVVGDVLARARLLHPPEPLDPGTVRTGTFARGTVEALDLARELETAELGALVETPEGHATFYDRARRSTVPASWFTDTPGQGQYGYHALEPLDERARVVNQATGSVTSEPPRVVDLTLRSGGGHVDVVMPATEPDDLLIVFVASTEQVSQQWLTPLWWVEHRNLRGERGMRVYTHWCDGTEGGTTVRFYTSPGNAGAWLANIIRVRNWYHHYRGIDVGEFRPGRTPPAIDVSWGLHPTLFIIAQVAMHAPQAGMGQLDPDVEPPAGYGPIQGNRSGGALPINEMGLVVSWKVDCTEGEDPGQVRGLYGYQFSETGIIAVRGYNGPFTRATLTNPETTGGEGRSATVEDLASQDRYQAVRSHPRPPEVFATENDARRWAEQVVSTHASGRPTLRLTFLANKTPGHRRQAIERRRGDMIVVTATGRAGAGIDAEPFIIESITHSIDLSGRWLVTWDLAPV